jgi:hypothetical protein
MRLSGRAVSTAPGREHLVRSLSHPDAGSAADTPWGLGRLDAVAMIFNRVTGLDISGRRRTS